MLDAFSNMADHLDGTYRPYESGNVGGQKVQRMLRRRGRKLNKHESCRDLVKQHTTQPHFPSLALSSSFRHLFSDLPSLRHL